jgi:flagellar biosynthesis GTPase FlhF
MISLRRKFNEFVNSKKPTGDPHCPPHIKQAKEIHKMIIAKSDSGSGLLNDEELAFNEEDAPLIEPQNLLPALDNTTTTSETAPSENATVSIRPMVTPCRQFGSGHSLGSNVGSLVDIMVTSMIEQQQLEARQREEQYSEREEQHREREERREELQQEREERREERKAEQEERRSRQQAEQEEHMLDRAQQQAQQLAQQQQQTMLMMLVFGAKKKNTREEGAPGGGEDEGLLE